MDKKEYLRRGDEAGYERNRSKEERLSDAKLSKIQSTGECEEIVKGMMEASANYIITGPPKVGKSFFILMLCECLKTGCDFFGFNVRRKKGLVIDTELTLNQIIRRGVRELVGDSLEFISLKEVDVSDRDIYEDDLERLEYYFELIYDYVRKNGIEVVFIDCLYTLCDESNPKHIKRLFSLMKDLNKLNATVILVHHNTKLTPNNSNPFASMAGSSFIMRAVSGALMLFPTGKMIKQGLGAGKKQIALVFENRSFSNDDLLVYLDDDCRFKIDHYGMRRKSEIANENIMGFITKYIPLVEEGRVSTNELKEAIKDHPEVGAPSYLEKALLSRWVDLKLIERIKEGNKYFYYREGNVDDDFSESSEQEF